jgi:uncharacterized protein (UPF0332 family)
MIPKTEKALKKDYTNCEKRRKFIIINKEAYKDYLDECQSDLASAEKDLENGSLKWSLIKIYQALFLLCNALLIKNLGFYSKDHKCLITALMKNGLISKGLQNNLTRITKNKSFFEEINKARLERNKAMYFPKSHRKLSNEEIKNTFNEIKQVILVLSEEL